MWKIGLWAMASVPVMLLAGCVGETSRVLFEINTPAVHERGPSSKSVFIENFGSDKKRHVYQYPVSPKRVIALHQNAVEAILALGAGESLLLSADVDENLLKNRHRSDFHRIPIRVTQQTSRETALQADPQLIVGWYSSFDRTYLGSTDFWHARGTATYIAPSSFGREGEGQSLKEEYQFIEDLGRIFQREERATELVNQMERQIRGVTEKTKFYPKKPRCIIIEFEGKEFRAYGRTTLGGNILMQLGVPLAFEGNHLSYEDLVAFDPDVIFVVNMDETEEGNAIVQERMYHTAGLKDIVAVRNHRVYAVPLYEMYCSGTRSYDGILRFAKGAYPELFID